MPEVNPTWIDSFVEQAETGDYRWHSLYMVAFGAMMAVPLASDAYRYYEEIRNRALEEFNKEEESRV